MFAHFQLSERILKENFSKRVKSDAKAMQQFYCLLKHLGKTHITQLEGV